MRFFLEHDDFSPFMILTRNNENYAWINGASGNWTFSYQLAFDYTHIVTG